MQPSIETNCCSLKYKIWKHSFVDWILLNFFIVFISIGKYHDLNLDVKNTHSKVTKQIGQRSRNSILIPLECNVRASVLKQVYWELLGCTQVRNPFSRLFINNFCRKTQQWPFSHISFRTYLSEDVLYNILS